MTPVDPREHPVAANDNGGADRHHPVALRKVNDTALQLVRIIGLRLICEDFATFAAANDNDKRAEGG